MIDFVHVYDVHTKARERLFDWIRPLRQEQYTQEFPFPHRPRGPPPREPALGVWCRPPRLREEPMPRPFSWNDLPINERAHPTLCGVGAGLGDAGAPDTRHAG